MKITKDTMRADGLTVRKALQIDRDFLTGIGIKVSGSIEDYKTPDEEADERTERVRDAVLAALDESLGGKGWTDQDLPVLFKALDAQIKRWEARRN